MLARAAPAVGWDRLLLATPPVPAKALSDGPNAWPLVHMRELLETLMTLDSCVKKSGYLEAEYGLGVPGPE